MLLPCLFKKLTLLLLVFSLSSCYWMNKRQLDQQHGQARAIQRISAQVDTRLYNRAHTIIENRCVVCHACYDAPCQLKLDSIEGVDRGASKTMIYDAYRLLAASPSHFFEHGEGHDEWRQQGFYPVLNERAQDESSNLELSVMYRMLALKKANPLPEQALLPDSFDLKLVRDQYCPKIEEFDDFSKKHALWGMPYGLPALEDAEFSVLEDWIAQGAGAPPRPDLPQTLQNQVVAWEAFLNGATLKEKLVSRYLYEHLYLANLYFDEVDSQVFFRIVRSYTPPGQPIRVMPSRRPYDAPLNPVFYYRLYPVHSSIVAKTHMPYALNERRYQLWQDLFFQPEYDVPVLPSYDVEVSSNPFVVFEAIPMKSRYKFLLEEAQFSIMNFIKGPVCRGQVALSVINDHFWVVFANPDLPTVAQEESFLRANKTLLRFPAYWQSNGRPWSWLYLARMQEQYITARADFVNRHYGHDVPVGLDVVWNGNGDNPNAALTVMRHFDSATVIKGFAGSNPQTAWLIDYPLLERIHYLLVAGFDVNGNLLHQLLTRMYMDFLRMEGEANFLALLPKNERQKIQHEWYAGADESVHQFFDVLLNSFEADSAIAYKTANPKEELLEMLADVTRAQRYHLQAGNYRDIDIHPLLAINGSRGIHLSYLAQTSILEVVGKTRSYWFSLIHHNTHENKTRLLSEDDVRTPEKDSLLVTADIISPYPNAFFKVNAHDLPSFVRAIKGLASQQDYRQLMNSYGVRRTDKGFWAYSDHLHEYYRQSAGLEYGLLDYNRLENR